MAVLGRADVVPVVTFDEGGINCLHTGPILYSRRNPDESLDLTLSRLMQKLFTWFEDYVSSKPEQWKYFPDSPAFLSHIDR
jgi:lauroyl/myristoyl acyltransferase